MGAIKDPPVWDGFDEQIQAGARAGVVRVARYEMRPLSDTLGTELPDDLIEILLDPLQSVQDALLGDGAVGPSNPRFVELVSELVTVAAIARNNYGETALSDPDVTRFIEQATWFLNSFGHA